MDKSIAYWIEKYLGLTIGIVAAFVSYLNWSNLLFIADDRFFDKLITICTTLFGFLLTVLTLIVQSNSNTIAHMKSHGSYNRLISFNKSIVILSAIICIYSLCLYFTNDMIMGMSLEAIKIMANINLVLFCWALTDTIIFVLIFYKILLADNSN